MKFIYLIIASLVMWEAEAQDCKVETKTLRGTYEGDCKNNKAEGQGIAKGQDIYSGSFKNGLPDGFGKYTWKTGSWYEGEWQKGERHGKGTMFDIDQTGEDSLKSGFWKNNLYIGKFETPYKIHYKTPSIVRAEVTKNVRSKNNEITIAIESTSGGATVGTVNRTQIPKFTITNLEIIDGQFQVQYDQGFMGKTNLTTYRDVIFPFRARISITGGELIEVEFLENGSYQLDIRINK